MLSKGLRPTLTLLFLMTVAIASVWVQQKKQKQDYMIGFFAEGKRGPITKFEMKTSLCLSGCIICVFCFFEEGGALWHLHSEIYWVQNYPNWVKWRTQRWVQKGPSRCWVIYTLRYWIKCFQTQHYKPLRQPTTNNPDG